MQIYLYFMTQFAKHPKTNEIHMTYDDIVKAMDSKGVNVSWRTVAGAIRHLEKVRVGKGHKTFLHRKRYGRYGRKSCLMLNPEISLGKGGKFNNLLIRYKNMDNKKHRKPQHAKQTELISKQYGKARYSSLYAEQAHKAKADKVNAKHGRRNKKAN